MDTFAALALATDPATKASLDRKPDRKNAPLITVEMLKMILIQATYQIIVCLVLHFAGHAILHMPYSTETDAELRSLVFNCFVFCQICERWPGLDLWLPAPAPDLERHRADARLVNQLNCRRLDRKFNVLEGFFRNYYFMVIFAISKSKSGVSRRNGPVLTLCSGGRSDPHNRSRWGGVHRPAPGWSGLGYLARCRLHLDPSWHDCSAVAYRAV
jgi:hypothetical protein